MSAGKTLALSVVLLGSSRKDRLLCIATALGVAIAGRCGSVFFKLQLLRRGNVCERRKVTLIG